MILKSRTESTELQILRTLNYRMNLPEKMKRYYLNLQKGYDGEKRFDSFIEKLTCDCLVLNDLVLNANNTNFQIDSLLIVPDAIYLFEVKNYEGNYFYESDRIYKDSKNEIVNPLTQLARTETLLRQLTKSLGYTLPIHASVVFINPEFTLYQTPLNLPFIFPTQLNRYMKQLDANSYKLTSKHKFLADKLQSLHIKQSTFFQLPAYEYEQLRKGIMCGVCRSFQVLIEGRKCVCSKCEYVEKDETAVIRAINEFKLLFPNEKLTTNIVYDWCKVVSSKRRIQTILNNNFQTTGVRQWTYYE